MTTIETTELVHVAGGLFGIHTAKGTIRQIRKCDRNAEHNFFGQPINQVDCYRRVLDEYK